MRTRFPWIVAVLVLVAIGFLLACNSKYSTSSNGLVIVPTQGTTEVTQATAVMETFSLNLANGAMSQINNVNGPPTPGLPGPVILDPAGAYAYVIVNQNAELAGSVTGITSFPVGSNGKLAAGTTTILNTVGGIPVQPVALAMDSAGKFLFVADSATNGVAGAVSVLAVASDGSLAELASSPFSLPVQPGGQTPSALALAVTPTVYPEQYSFCSGHTPPTTENLYVADSVNYALLNYSVDPSAGTLTLNPYSTSLPGIPTGSVPSGVAVDPCNRFVYVSNTGPGAIQNNVSAYSICSAINLTAQPPCAAADFSLHTITGSPFATNGNNPGPLAVDAYGKFLYVVNTGSGNVSSYKINATSGALSIFLGANVVAGQGANSIAIRSDDSWLFVANLTSGSLSQYAITPSSGILDPVGPVSTLVLPSGVAVK
jgi:6-phosphogluconolactonase (cycloisomerase 2 family)